MKIRSHFILIVLTLAAVPILFLTAFATYLYITSPERILFDGLSKLEGFDIKKMTSADRAAVTKYLRERPPDLEEAFFFSDGLVILSTIPSIPSKGRINADKMSSSIFEKAKDYNYQITSIPFKSYDGQLIHLIRYPRGVAKKGALTNGTLPRPRNFIAIFAIIFEAFFIALSLTMFKKIESSLNLVEKEAQKLRDGDIDRPIEIPLDKGYSNEITRLLANIEEFRKVFKERKSQRDRFVMGISHDLKTPLAVIKGYTEGIVDGLFNDSQKMNYSLEIILQKCGQLEKMIDDIISFIKMNDTDWTKNFADCDLLEYLTEFEKYANATGGVFNRTINCEIKIPKGTIVRMDKQLVSRALENLFSNAIRYTAPQAKIDARAEIAGGKAVLSISDNGIGMSPEDTEHVFELFYRGTHSRREQGQGIGLSVVKTVMDIHGWEIGVKSEKGVGTCFTIKIPIIS